MAAGVLRKQACSLVNPDSDRICVAKANGDFHLQSAWPNLLAMSSTLEEHNTLGAASQEGSAD